MSTQTASVNSFGGCNQHSGWMRARSPNTKTISHSRPPRLRIMLKTGFRPPPDCLIKPLQVALANYTWMASGCFSSPLDFFITANFSKASQQRSQFSANKWTSQFAFCSIYSFRLKGPIYCLQKRTKKKCQAPLNCFVEIWCWQPVLNFKLTFFFFLPTHGLLSHQRIEQEWREMHYKKGGTELLCYRTLWLCCRLVPGEAALRGGKSRGREKHLTKDGIGRI